MLSLHRLNHTSSAGKKRTSVSSCAAVLASIIMAASFLTGCSGTGTMYTPESFEDSPEYSDTAATASEAAADGGYNAGSGQEPGADGEAAPGEAGKVPGEAASEEEPRTLRAELEGTGSDLYTAQAVYSYYNFTLDGVSYSLPGSFKAFLNEGWELAENSTGDPLTIPSYSFEYVDAVPSAETGKSSFGSKSRPKTIRLCLANFTENTQEASSCTVCGISVSEDSGALLKTAFGAGIGSSIDEMTSVFGTDSSVYKLTKYTDGTYTLRYHFANGLNEGETIPVLAEADDKSIAELLLADTKEDGKTIRNLSLYFFRLP